MTKLNAIYMMLCATVVVAGVAVHASQGPGEASLTGISEKSVLDVIEAVRTTQ